MVTPVSLCTHNLAWRAEASPALPLGPWCPEGCYGRQSHALLSGSLILSYPSLPSFSVQNTCIPSSMTVVWGPPSQPYPHWPGNQVSCQEGPTSCLLRKREAKHVQLQLPLWQRAAHQEVHKLGLNIARALVCAVLECCRHQWFGQQ